MLLGGQDIFNLPARLWRARQTKSRRRKSRRGRRRRGSLSNGSRGNNRIESSRLRLRRSLGFVVNDDVTLAIRVVRIVRDREVAGRRVDGTAVRRICRILQGMNRLRAAMCVLVDLPKRAIGDPHVPVRVDALAIRLVEIVSVPTNFPFGYEYTVIV